MKTAALRWRPASSLLAPSSQLILLFAVGYFGKTALLLLDQEHNLTFAAYATYHPAAGDILLMTTAFIALLIGVFIGRTQPTRRLRTALAKPIGTSRGLNVLGLVGVILAIAALASLSLSAGLSPLSLRPFSTTTRAALLAQFQGRGFIALFITLLPLFVVMTKKPQRRFPNALFLGSVFVAAGILSVVGSRLLLLGMLLSAGMAVRLDARRRPRIGRELFLLACMAFFGAALGTLIMPGFDLTSPVDLLRRLMGTFDMADTLVLARRHSNRFLGLTFFEDSFYTYIPRNMWHGKPQFYGGYRLQEVILPGIGASSGNSAFYPTGLVGEGLLNFGTLGAVLLPGIAGYATARIDWWAVQPGFRRVLYCFFAGQMLTLLRSPGQFLSFSLVVVGLAWFAERFVIRVQSPDISEVPLPTSPCTG